MVQQSSNQKYEEYQDGGNYQNWQAIPLKI